MSKLEINLMAFCMNQDILIDFKKLTNRVFVVSSITSIIFEPVYKDALAKSGYTYKLEYDPEAAKGRDKNANRKRRITWFNPPYSQNVKTKVGEKFLSLIDSCFPPDHPLRKICNRNTLKLSYRCTPNIGTIISAKNSKLLQPPREEKRM